MRFCFLIGFSQWVYLINIIFFVGGVFATILALNGELMRSRVSNVQPILKDFILLKKDYEARMA